LDLCCRETEKKIASRINANNKDGPAVDIKIIDLRYKLEVQTLATQSRKRLEDVQMQYNQYRGRRGYTRGKKQEKQDMYDASRKRRAAEEDERIRKEELEAVRFAKWERRYETLVPFVAKQYPEVEKVVKVKLEDESPEAGK